MQYPIEPWDDALGVPINQQHLLGTLFSFSVVGIESLRRSGVRLSTYQKEAYIHVWNLVGHQLGIRSDLLPLSWADSQALWDHRRRTESGPRPREGAHRGRHRLHAGALRLRPAARPAGVGDPALSGRRDG